MALRIEVGFDGANPQDEAAVEQVDQAVYRVHPSSEDGDANYKFALNVRLVNDGQGPAPARVDVDWADEQYQDSRGFGYVGGGDHWRFVPATVHGAVASYSLSVPPGMAHLGLSPAYGYGEYRRFSESGATAGWVATTVGASDGGRPIERFRIGSGPTRVLVVARYHPYETASSFCIEGLMDWLGRGGTEQERILNRCTVTALPMPNPDGVHLGLCKRTAVGGVDLPHEGPHRADETARVLMAVLDDVAPHAYLDIHGWMHLNEDGLHYLDEGLRQRFEAGAAAGVFAGNRWLGSRMGADPSGGSLVHYLRDRHGTRGLSVSYRWMGRTVAQMRALGGPTLTAFAAAL